MVNRCHGSKPVPPTGITITCGVFVLKHERCRSIVEDTSRTVSGGRLRAEPTGEYPRVLMQSRG